MSPQSQPRVAAGVPQGGEWRVGERLDTPDLVIDEDPFDSVEANASYEPINWPPVKFEQRPWHAFGPMAKAGVTYSPSVLPRISRSTFDLPPGLLRECDEATQELVRFDAEMARALPPFGKVGQGGGISPMASLMLRTESSASSNIEGVQANAQQVASAEVGYGRNADATLIAANVTAMEVAFDVPASAPIDTGMIRRIHAALMAGEDFAGKVRREQVWIGGSKVSPVNAAWVPPHQDRLDGALDDLEAFMRRTDIPPLPHAAIAHAQFETIHPFADGNGRGGRALVQMLLRHRGLTRSMAVPVSSGLIADTGGYFHSLDVYRKGDARKVVEQFNRAAIRAVRNGRVLVDDLAGVRERWAGDVKANAHSNAWPTLDLVMRHPVLTRQVIQDRLGVSQPTASSVVKTLLEAEVIEPVNRKERNQVFRSREVLAALDAFTVRAHQR